MGRYMLAYMIEGEAKAYHLELSNRMAARYELKPISERIGPHFTIKSPFETDDTSAISDLLAAFAVEESPQPVMLGGFRHFTYRVVYVDAAAPKQTHLMLRRLQDKLRTVSWLDFWSNEFPLTLHATLVRARNPEQGKEMLAYLKSEPVKTFDLSIDTVTLLEKREGKWHSIKRYPLVRDSEHGYYTQTGIF